ncbi:MAG: hypothetical protein CVU41_02670 [Chloroflexi bacterium HGW-Chloroflexi-3]|nr:MAG: hypothetical protein CVU41_02670 [Chloroflexi bacterium HGW-Chloroflexi-3]
MDTSLLINHMLISVVGWMCGLALGGSLGHLIAKLLFTQPREKLYRSWVTILIPWRTVIFLSVIFVWSPLLVIKLGLGNFTGTVMVGTVLAIFALAMVMKMIFDQMYSKTTWVIFISNARSLLLIAIFATLGVGYVGAGGFGFYLSQQLNLLNYDKLVEGILVLSGLALFCDLILGLVQYWISRRIVSSEGDR